MWSPVVACGRLWPKDTTTSAHTCHVIGDLIAHRDRSQHAVYSASLCAEESLTLFPTTETVAPNNGWCVEGAANVGFCDLRAMSAMTFAAVPRV